uniref:Uncharacterized protein n=1 Tax=Drosophila-associated filamentous virus TaxID=2743186 RepID=A0A6M9U029_9VIRU|nr:putative protein 60 [Drosophila-associated filamentous virus]
MDPFDRSNDCYIYSPSEEFKRKREISKNIISQIIPNTSSISPTMKTCSWRRRAKSPSRIIRRRSRSPSPVFKRSHYKRSSAVGRRRSRSPSPRRRPQQQQRRRRRRSKSPSASRKR